MAQARADGSRTTATVPGGRPCPPRAGAADPGEAEPVNEVRLVGRVSAEPDSRTMPSGDELVVVRLVVARPPERPRRAAADSEPATRRPTVDTIDIACWAAGLRRTALRLRPGDVVEVHGALRRRFYRAGAVALSRYEVEAAGLRRA